MASTKFICLICQKHFSKRVDSAYQPCPDCGGDSWWEGSWKHSGGDKKDVRRTPLTKWQEKKLSWYRDERKWHEDIKSRKVMSDGKVAIVDHRGRIKEVRD